MSRREKKLKKLTCEPKRPEFAPPSCLTNTPGAWLAYISVSNANYSLEEPYMTQHRLDQSLVRMFNYTGLRLELQAQK